MSLGGMLPPIVAHLVAESGEFAAKMGEAEALVHKVTGSANASWAQAGKAAMGVGGVMAVAAGTVALATIKMASDFQTQMERVHTQAGASQSEVDSLSQKVIDLGAATGQGPTKLAEALFHVESVGYRGATAMAVLDNAAKLASISGANLDDTTYGLTSVMQTYGAKAKDAAHWASFFNAVVGAGDMKMQDFNKAVGTGYFSAAQTFGLSAQSAGAALAFMTDRGQSADAAATHLRMTIALLAAPSLKATNILHGLGLTNTEVAHSHELVNGVLAKSKVTYSQLATDLTKPDGFYVALQHLKKGLEDSGMSAAAANAQLSHAFGGGKSDSTILAMLNNLDTLRSKYDAVGKGMGNFASAYKASAETASGQMDRFKASAAGLGIEIGNVLMPYFLGFLGWVKTGTEWMRTHAAAVKAIALLIGVTLVTGLGLATAGAIAFAAATVEVWGPLLLGVVVVEAIIAALILLWKNWDKIWGWIVDRAKAVGSWLADAWHSIAKTVSSVWDGILGFFRRWWPALIGIFFPAIGLIAFTWQRFGGQIMSSARIAWSLVYTYMVSPVINAARAIYSWMTNVGNSIRNAFGGILGWLRGLWNSFWSIGSYIMSGLWSGISGWFNSIRNGVSNFLGGMVGWAKNVLGIHSPSKVFEEEVGRWIPEGVAVGINVHSHVASSSITGMVAKLRAAGQVAYASGLNLPGVSVAGAAVSGAIAASSTNVVHVHLTSVAQVDGKVLFQTQQEQALQYERRNSQAAFSS